MYLGESSDDSFKYYIDRESVKKLPTSSSYPYLRASNSGQIVSFFTKFDFVKAQKTADGRFYNSTIFQRKGDCANNKYSFQGYIDYTKGGSVVDSGEWSEENWHTVYPDTVAESWLNAACYHAGYRSAP